MNERLHADARAILLAGVAAADPAAAVRRALDDDDSFAHIVAIGKAAGAMAGAALQRSAGASAFIVAPHGSYVPGASERVRVLRAAHPLPDMSSLAAGQALDELLEVLPEGEPLLFLISGGASALAVLPAGGITFGEYAHCTGLLMRSGADIRELNTVRHHIDSLKGGGIAQRTVGRCVVALVLSDVIGDPLDIIASGPLTRPRDTPADAVRVLRARGVWNQCAPSIREALSDAGVIVDPVPTDHIETRIIANNRTAVDGAAAEAARLGYDIRMIDEPLSGEARSAGAALARLARDTTPNDRPVCIVAGGETTVTVTGSGTGGRNLELALSAALHLDRDNIVIATLATDGIDGSSPSAGAICDSGTLHLIGRAAAETALTNNDSHSALEAANALLHTGPTGTNVADLAVALIGSALPRAGA